MRNLLNVFAAVVLVSAADPPKPMWPGVFDAQFGLYTSTGALPAIVNGTAFFYYDWSNLRSQIIDYSERCIPIVPFISDTVPCRLYFNPSGTYLHIPKLNKDCCKNSAPMSG